MAIILTNGDIMNLEWEYWSDGTVSGSYYLDREYLSTGTVNNIEPIEFYHSPTIHVYDAVIRCTYCGRKNSLDADECKGCGAIL